MSHSSRERSRRRSDEGFTLVEVVITFLCMGIIVAVIASVASVVYRNTPTTETRAEDARSVLGLVTWLPQDVDSTPPTGFDQTPSTPSGCGNDPAGSTNILRLAWTENAGGGIATFIANYRHADVGDAFRLLRITCSGFTTPYTNAVRQNVTSDLPDLPSGWTPGNAPLDVFIDRDTATNDVELVTFEITTISGEVISTDSAPKNPANTLPTTTLPSWYVPTPTTGVFTNTPPTASNHTLSVYPNPVYSSVNLSVSDIDGQSLVVELDPLTIPSGWVVNLSSVTLSVSPSVVDVGLTKVVEYTVNDQNGGVTRGYVTVQVIPTTTPTTTTTTTTSTTTTSTTTTVPLCAVTSAGLSPASVKNVQADGSPGQVNVGVLFKSVAVSVTTNNYCNGMEIRYDTGGVNSPGFLNLTQTGSNTWAGTLIGRDEGSSETWSDGPHPISIHSSTGGPWATVTLTVT